MGMRGRGTGLGVLLWVASAGCKIMVHRYFRDGKEGRGMRGSKIIFT